MSSKYARLYSALTYAGAIPFLACAVAVHLGMTHFYEVALSVIVTSYGLAIVSFLAGTHWATQLHQNPISHNLFITSNIITLVTWAAFWSMEVVWSVLILVVCFIGLLVIDHELKGKGVIQSHYYQLRRNVTYIVLLSLVGFAVGIT